MATAAIPITRARPVARIVLTCAVITFGVFLASNRTLYVLQFLFPMFSLSLVSMLIFHFSVRRAWIDLIHVASVTLLCGTLAFLFMYFPYHSIAWMGFAGISSFLVLTVRSIWSRGEERKLGLLAVLSCVLLLVLEFVAASALHWTEPWFPRTLDLYLFSFDGSLGGQFRFGMGRAFSSWPSFGKRSGLFYNGLPVIISLVCARQIAARSAKALPVVGALILTGPIGVFFYSLFPALGPAHIAQLGFPYHPVAAAHLALAHVAARGPRNAIPSLHMAWVLLAWWYSRGLGRWARAIAFVFIVFTIFSTIGTGEHYVVDLVVAFPFAVFIESLFSFSLSWRMPRKVASLVWGLGAVLAWLLLLRYAAGVFWVTPAIPWALMGATVAISLWMESRLSSQAVSGNAGLL